MLIDRVIYPITALGPGNRLAIWTVGCSKHCTGCSNPELWDFDDRKDMDVEQISERVHKMISGKEVDGITFTGGDPFEQPSDLLRLISLLRDISEDIIVYTGYTYRELTEILTAEQLDLIKQNVSLLIDGRYIDELNDGKCVLRGSTNQQLYFFNQEKKEIYTRYLSERRKIQNVYRNGEIVSVGIHSK